MTLQSFSISGVISAEKYKLKIENFTDVCMTEGTALNHQSDHTNICKFFNFQLYIFSADITPDMLKLCRVTKVKVFFLVLVYIFNFNLYEFLVAILEKGLINPMIHMYFCQNTHSPKGLCALEYQENTCDKGDVCMVFNEAIENTVNNAINVI